MKGVSESAGSDGRCSQRLLKGSRLAQGGVGSLAKLSVKPHHHHKHYTSPDFAFFFHFFLPPSPSTLGEGQGGNRFDFSFDITSKSDSSKTAREKPGSPFGIIGEMFWISPTCMLEPRGAKTGRRHYTSGQENGMPAMARGWGNGVPPCCGLPK